MVEGSGEVAALLPPLRRMILDRLQAAPDSATGLARDMGMARQKVNYHVRALERAGFLELAGERQRRGCTERRFRPTARAYIISPELLGEAAHPAVDNLRDRFSSAYLITAAARMIRDVAALRRKAGAAGKSLPTLAIEFDARFASAGRRAAFAEELTEAVAALAVRYQDGSPHARSYRFVIGGHPVPA